MKIVFLIFFAALSFADPSPLVQWKTGDDKVQLQRSPDGALTVKGGAADGFVLSSKDSVYVLRNSKGVAQKSSRANGDSWEVLSVDGKRLHRLKFEGEQGKLYSSTDVLEARFKLKEQKINFYDSQAKRTARGKPKDDGLSIKTEGSTATEMKIKGTKSLREGGLLGLPLPDDERILFWSLERKP